MPLSLTSRLPDDGIGVDASPIVLAVLNRPSSSEIERLTIRRGNRAVPLGDCFVVRGSAEDGVVEFSGNLRSVHGLGQSMTDGRVVIQGDIGDHLGNRMRGGQIEVEGSARNWLAAEMRGGLIRVSGDVGDDAGAAYRASVRGMRGGTLLVHGQAGDRMGTAMRRGLIAVGGDCGSYAGLRMLAGTIVVAGKFGSYPGAEMKRGTLLQLSEFRDSLLPTFTRGFRGQSPAVNLILRELLRLEFPISREILEREFAMWHGDMLQGGRGEVFFAV